MYFCKGSYILPFELHKLHVDFQLNKNILYAWEQKNRSLFLKWQLNKYGPLETEHRTLQIYFFLNIADKYFS